jgi:hypothetical protein
VSCPRAGDNRFVFVRPGTSPAGAVSAAPALVILADGAFHPSRVRPVRLNGRYERHPDEGCTAAGSRTIPGKG